MQAQKYVHLYTLTRSLQNSSKRYFFFLIRHYITCDDTIEVCARAVEA